MTAIMSIFFPGFFLYFSSLFLQQSSINRECIHVLKLFIAANKAYLPAKLFGFFRVFSKRQELIQIVLHKGSRNPERNLSALK